MNKQPEPIGKIIMDTLNRMIVVCNTVQVAPVAQQLKDKVKLMTIQAIDFVYTESSPAKINQLVADEMRKKMKARLIKNDV